MMSALSKAVKGKQVAIAVIALLLVFGGHTAFAEEPVRSDGVNGLIEEAVENNPELRAIGQKVQAFEQRPSQARSVENPRLKMSALNLPMDTFNFDQEAMTQKQISFMQKLPFPGKLGLRGEIAEKELAVVVEEYSEKKNSIIKKLKVTYNDLLFLDRALAVTMENRALLAEAIRTTETKYAVGQGGQREILKAQMEHSRTIKRILTLKQKKAVASGHWPLYRYNPQLEDEGKNPLHIDSKEPTISFADYALGENRYRMLKMSNPEMADQLMAMSQKDVDKAWKFLKGRFKSLEE